jgi:hypothetical protein
MSAATPVLTGGRPPRDRPESQVQYSRKRRRCHRRTVSGETMTAPAANRSRFWPGRPEQAVSRAELWAGHRSFVDGELLAQGQVLESELMVAADEEREEPERVE